MMTQMETKSFTLNQLIDISLNTPDIGTVNFKILRTVLKIIVKELDIHDVCARVPIKDLQQPAEIMGRYIKKKERRKTPQPPGNFQHYPPRQFFHKPTESISDDDDPPPLHMANNPKVSIASESPSEEQTPSVLNEDPEEQVGPEEQVELNKQNLEVLEEGEAEELEEENINAPNPSPGGSVIQMNPSGENRHQNAEYSSEKSSESDTPLADKNKSLAHKNAAKLHPKHDEYYSNENVSTIEERSNEGSSGSNSFIIEKSAVLRKKESFDIISISSETRCTGNKWMVSNMWKTMNFARRIDAIETGVDKIISVLNDHVRNMDRQRRDFERKKRMDIEISETIEKNIDNLIDSVNDINSRMDFYISKEDHTEYKHSQERKFFEVSQQHEALADTLAKVQEKFDSEKKVSEMLEAMDVFDERLRYLEDNSGAVFEQPHGEQSYHRTTEENVAVVSRRTDLTNIDSMYDDFMEKIKPLIERFEKQFDLDSDAGEPATLTEQLMNVKVNIKQLSTDNNKLREQIESLQFEIKKQNDTIDMLVDISEKGFHPEDKEDFYEMQKKLRIMEKEFDQLEILDELQNAIVSLRTIKANKAEIEVALQKKAEIRDVICKVNKNEYEAMVKDMSSGLQEMMGKIVIQEQSLQKAVQNLTNELDNKVDRLEIEGSSETLHARLKSLAAKVKQLQCVVEYDTPVAAGTKTAVAKCISCDRPMRKLQEASVKSLPANLLSPSKTTLEAPQIVSVDQKHYIPSAECNHVGRTTGGPFTITNPELHATTFPKITVFNKNEWESIPLKGTDNVLYRGQIEKLPPVSRKIGLKNLMDEK